MVHAARGPRVESSAYLHDYEIGEHEGQRFLAMELLEGETVKQRILGGPFGLAVMLSLGMEVADVFD
ncbi:MAG: hypothetical protein WB559_04260, partial [Candidatus Acidiferrales bacterium]